MHRKPLLILDIDQTLLHACVEPLARDHDFRTTHTYVYKRPGVDDFLEFCAEHFRVGIWTTAGPSFAGQIRDILFGPAYPLKFLRTVEHCTRFSQGLDKPVVHVKDLSQLSTPLDNIVMIDDSPEKLQVTPGNLVAVRPYYGEHEDDELQRLTNYLNSIKGQPAIGHLNKQDWREHVSAGELS